MKVFPAGLIRLAAPFFGAAALLAHAGEKIEFSGESTKPILPKPGSKMDELEGRLGSRRDSSGPVDLGVGPASPQGPVISRKALEKILQDYDKKKNWLVPGAQDFEGAIDKKIEKDDASGLDGDKEQSVLERFIQGTDARTQRSPLSSKDPDRERSQERDNTDGRRDLFDAPPSQEGNGLGDFNLRAFLNPGQTQKGSTDSFIRKPESNFQRNIQPFNPDRTAESNRRAEQEKEAARAAEFQQLLKPRTGGMGNGSFGMDPIIGQTDSTRRELNPINPLAAPRSAESPFRSDAFNNPASRSIGPSDSGMFGIATPPAAAASITPSYTPSSSPIIPAPTYVPGSIQLERPRRPF